jgi:hypothetical protein
VGRLRGEELSLLGVSLDAEVELARDRAYWAPGCGNIPAAFKRRIALKGLRGREELGSMKNLQLAPHKVGIRSPALILPLEYSTPSRPRSN